MFKSRMYDVFCCSFCKRTALYAMYGKKDGALAARACEYCVDVCQKAIERKRASGRRFVMINYTGEVIAMLKPMESRMMLKAKRAIHRLNIDPIKWNGNLQ